MEEIKEHSYKWYEFGCKDASYLKTKADYETLSFSEKALYKFHMATCRYCRRFVRQVDQIDQLLKAAVSGSAVRISPERKQALNQLITEKLKKN
jgi:hypothetical protein